MTEKEKAVSMRTLSPSFSLPAEQAVADRRLRTMARRAGLVMPASAAPAGEEALFSERGNTHLWIVNRAAELLRDEGAAGGLVYELVKPSQYPQTLQYPQTDRRNGENPALPVVSTDGAYSARETPRNSSDFASGEIGDAFHDSLCQGIYDADHKAPYNDPMLPSGLCPIWKSHFYDPDTQTNWLGQKTPTAVTRATSYYELAREAYCLGHARMAGYALGLALHYMGDLTQPMHAANFTWLSSRPCGYHTAFEEYAGTMLQYIQLPQRFQPLALGVMPQGYLKAVARRTKDTYYRKVCRPEWLQAYRKEEVTSEIWHQRLGLLIGPMLADAVLMTAQFLLSWAESLAPVQKNPLSRV
jgi:phospholipase C